MVDVPVIVSDSNNAAYDGKLGTVNGWYQAEAYNLGVFTTTVTLLSTVRTINVTFANSGNCQGIGVMVFTSAQTDRNIQADLEEAKTVGSFNTSTERINITTHGLSDGQQVRFSSTGTLPTGITAGTIYYVINSTASDFQISTSLGGSVQGLSGTPTGTATCWVQRATKTLAWNEIASITASQLPGIWITPFKFTTPYAVDTTASKWRFAIVQTGGTQYNWNIKTSDGTNPGFIAWCDNQVSFTNDDIPFIADPIAIDTDCSFGAALGTGDTTYGVGGWIGRSPDGTTPGLTWVSSPAASYTLTIKGLVLQAAHSKIKIGDSAARIPYAQKAVLTFNTASVGTVAPAFYSCSPASTTYEYGGKSSFELYGEIPTVMKTTLANDASSGQKDLVTTDATGWQIGDRFVIGKSTVMTADYTVYTIANIVGTTITTTVNITNNRLAGASVFRLGGMGVEMTNTAGQNVYVNYGLPSKMIVSGVYSKNCSFYINSNTSYIVFQDDLANRAQFQFTDICTETTGTAIVNLITNSYVPELGYLVQRVYAFKRSIITGVSGLNKNYSGLTFRYGLISFKDCVTVQKYSSNELSSVTSLKYEVDNYSLEHSQYGGISIGGTNSSVKNSSFWGQNGTTYASQAAFVIYSPVNFVSENNTFDACQYCFSFTPGASVNGLSFNDIFGQTTANTYEVATVAGALIDFTFESSTGDPVVDTTEITDTTLGSKIRFVDSNNITNNDRTLSTYGRWNRTGDSLADTTVHTSGTDKFAMRFEPLSSADLLEWEQKIPTGNIQNKTMMLACWVKINSANYWAGTHQMPRLTVDYDNEVNSAYAEAAQSTDWQLLLVPITPTTTFGQITATVSGRTDATSTDAYYYVDDFSYLPPAGVIVNTGGLDLWAKAEPIWPTMSTLFGVNDLWIVPISTLTGAGTIGNKLKKSLTLPQFMGLK